MLSWQVGRVTITRIVEIDLPVPVEGMPQATPTASATSRSRRAPPTD
jgi:hypothetical protein